MTPWNTGATPAYGAWSPSVGECLLRSLSLFLLIFKFCLLSGTFVSSLQEAE